MSQANHASTTAHVCAATPSEISEMIDALDAVDPRPSVADLVSALEANVDRHLRRELVHDARRMRPGHLFADAAARRIYANSAIVWG